MTINSTAVSLPRVFSSDGSGSFRNYDAKAGLKIRHAYGRRTRRDAAFEYSKITTDPLVSTTNVLASLTMRFSADVPPSGFSAAEQLDSAKVLVTWLSANSYANAIKLFAGEN